jgi:hypothetical protein
MTKEEKMAQRMAVQLETMRRSGLLSYPRHRFRSIDPELAQVVQRERGAGVIDVRSGKPVSEIDPLRPGEVEILVPDCAFLD